jgi:hypothetical protein
MSPSDRNALAELAILVAVAVERAPGPAEKRLALFRGFEQAHRIDESISPDPQRTLLDTLLRDPRNLIHHLKGLWMGPDEPESVPPSPAG